MSESRPIVAHVYRYETDCCGFLFNYGVRDEEPISIQDTYRAGDYVGSEIGGECPGCRKMNPGLTRVPE